MDLELIKIALKLFTLLQKNDQKNFVDIKKRRIFV